MGICIIDGEKVICCSQAQGGRENVTSLSIRLFTLGGVSALTIYTYMYIVYVYA